MLNVASLRRQFPALNQTREGRISIFLDGPAGTQVPQRVIDAMVYYLSHCNANHGGAFATSRESDAIVGQAHAAMADFLNAPSAEEIVFGPNMTTLTFHLSRAIGRTLKPGDEVIVTRLDHDANVRPWVLAARDAGATVQWVDFHPEDCTLDLDELRGKLGSRTRLVAVGAASNTVGTINDVATITKLAHAAGALVFVDAVHLAPHAPIDVQAWDCDFLACSAYKFFGPHVGILWGRRHLLEELPAYKVRPAPEKVPDRWMTGTPNHEGLAGVAAAIEYLAAIGHNLPASTATFPGLPGRRQHLRAALTAIQAYEATLARRLLDGLAGQNRLKVWGITDAQSLAQRVPTVAITSTTCSPLELAQRLAQRQIYVWNGNNYALELSERLGVEERGGFVRLGLVHYNTAGEVDEVLRTLGEVV